MFAFLLSSEGTITSINFVSVPIASILSMGDPGSPSILDLSNGVVSAKKPKKVSASPKNSSKKLEQLYIVSWIYMLEKPFVSSTILTLPDLSNLFQLSFKLRPSHLLQMSSSEACQDHQKLNSFTPFPSFNAYPTNSIPQIIIHPKNMQFMERLAFFLLS